jgi:hypothetical protein
MVETKTQTVRLEAGAIAAAAAHEPFRAPEMNGVTPPANRPVSNSSTQGVGASDPPRYLVEALKDAERLLKYAAETGVTVGDDLRRHVIQARSAGSGGWNEEIAANLLSALTQISALVKPVSAASLKWCEDTRPAVNTYFKVAICLAILIVPFSFLGFLATAISTAIRTDIVTGNDLAVKLRVIFPPKSAASSPSEPPPGIAAGEVVTDLQLFASNIRSIDARARQLNKLVCNSVRDPQKDIRKSPEEIHKVFELPDNLPDLAAAAYAKIKVYQDERYFAQKILDDVSFYYGAVTTCILPVLYALLGTCAYLLRSFEQQIQTHTLIPSEVNIARFLIAGIGGAVVGLFNNFNIAQGASIPPLAIAFLVGYAVDVFFAFLEGLLQTFAKNTTISQAPPTTGRVIGAPAS